MYWYKMDMCIESFIALGSCRDTTVQTLTLQPSVRDGIIVYEDSPLVSILFQSWFCF